MSLKYRHSSKTKAQWEALNPVIVENEIVIENDTNALRIGNGIDSYSDLKYATAGITVEEVDAKIGAEVDTLSDRIDTVEGIANAATGGSLGSIKPTDAAPTPARNGNYTFSIGGNKPAWLTAEAGVTTVKAGDGVAVVYTAPNTYSYTHVDVSSFAAIIANEINDRIPIIIYLSENEYQVLLDNDLVLPNVQYNIYE